MNVAWMFTLWRNGKPIAQSRSHEALDYVVDRILLTEGGGNPDDWKITGDLSSVSELEIKAMGFRAPSQKSFEEDPNIQ